MTTDRRRIDRKLYVVCLSSATCDDALGFTREQRVHVRINLANAGHDMSKINPLLTRIAQTKLHIETLEVRGSDRLDFHDVSVESLREALEAAYNAGIEQRRKTIPAVKSTD